MKKRWIKYLKIIAVVWTLLLFYIYAWQKSEAAEECRKEAIECSAKVKEFQNQLDLKDERIRELEKQLETFDET